MTQMNYEQFAQELDAIKQNTMAKVGKKDADYIRRVIRWQRYCSWTGRLMLLTGLIHPALWVVGILLLATSKILDNMEIGHNVMHGQYDWMNDKPVSYTHLTLPTSDLV